MTPDDSYQAPLETEAAETGSDDANLSDTPQDSDPQHDRDALQVSDTQIDDQEPDLQAAKKAWTSADIDADADDNLSDEDRTKLSELAQPFIGQWNNLISTTNWEKGRIISEWREALIESGVDATQYSDEAWARRVGGVTSPHVGRLRRVYDRFGSTYATYDDVYWSHFLAALDWDDAPMWLEGASREAWSVSNMREQRWQANGAVESQRPTKSQIVDVDLDEDVTIPAQGGGRNKEYGDEPGDIASGPRYDEPDFGDEEELSSMSKSGSGATAQTDDTPESFVQPFVGLPELPDDLSDAMESFKLALLRHKAAGWNEVSADDIQLYLDAISVMLKA
ncbi:MAG: hypothetical protein HKN47_12550 [Pirellulaceae bacterium]|nr:hypothetical protein [Pirellulaceae bacterium]